MFRKEQINRIIAGGQIAANGNKSSREETNYTKGARDRCSNYSSDVLNKWKRIDEVRSTSGGFGAGLERKLFI